MKITRFEDLECWQVGSATVPTSMAVPTESGSHSGLPYSDIIIEHRASSIEYRVATATIPR